MKETLVIQIKTVTLQPNNIVEPFNHQRKGHTNEYKVSTYPKESW